MPIITCPHCGARRNTSSEKLPPGPANTRCPECSNQFPFDPASIARQADDRTITCPHCKLPRTIPNNRQANLRATVTCRRCQHPFPLVKPGAQTADHRQPAVQLSSIGQLLASSWELFCQRGWGLLAIYLTFSLLIIVPLLLAAAFLPALDEQTPFLTWSSIVSASLFGLLGSAWMAASIFSHICERKLSVLAAINKGRLKLWEFAGLLLLLGLIIIGGSLLLIVPGIIFCIWFFCAHYILIDEGLTGLQALNRSRQLVRGHWWAVFGRFLLLLLTILAVTTLTARLPLIGAPLNIVFSLLLVPFSLLYLYRLYQDLKLCQQHSSAIQQDGFGLPMVTSLLGWMLIPGLLFAVNNWQKLPSDELTTASSAIVAKLFNHDQALLLKRAEQPPAKQSLPMPEALTRDDYDRLLNGRQSPAPKQGVKLGPATLSAEQFWPDEREPHLWLKLQLADLPNLALSHRHSTRILIDKVLDDDAQDRYDREHSFEHGAFHWIDVLADNSPTAGFGGIRNVYLKQGTRPEQIRRIVGQLELNLPLGIESLQLGRNDIGKTLQVAGKSLTLETMNADGISLRFHGERSELLSVRAVNQQTEPLNEAGSTWQQRGEAFSLKQMFNGNIDSVTILVANDSITRRYPFELSR